MKIEDLNNFLKWSSAMGRINTNEISDGQNTFEELYKQRMTLLAVVINSYPELSSKTSINDDEFNIVISTPLGATAFTIENNYWDFFNIRVNNEIEEPEDKENIDKLLSLVNITDYTKNKVRERK